MDAAFVCGSSVLRSRRHSNDFSFHIHHLFWSLMPIALDPNQTVPFSLAIDRDKPEHVRPVFLLGYLTCRQTLAYEALIEKAAEKSTQAERNANLNKALSLLIRDWTNVKDVQGNDVVCEPMQGTEWALDDVLTPEEKWEFALEGRKAIRLSESDKKKSLSQPDTATEKSAPAAPSNAGTSPQS
jgi:hypothetical protein